MDLEYLLQGINDGTVTIINLSKRESKSLCSEIKPSELKLKGRYTVIRFERAIMGEKIDYFISVLER